MPFSEKVKSVYFTTSKQLIPVMKIIFLDDSIQVWYWSFDLLDWIRDDKGLIKL